MIIIIIIMKTVLLKYNGNNKVHWNECNGVYSCYCGEVGD